MIQTIHFKQLDGLVQIMNELPVDKVGFCSDSRVWKTGDCFAAIPGEKFDPLDFVPILCDKGLTLLMFQCGEGRDERVAVWQKQYPQLTAVGVKDMVSAIQDLARRHTEEWRKNGGRVFAISGSNGKTTTKEMLSHILKSALSDAVVATEKNNNNHLGVPFTLLQIKDHTKICVLELGSNHPGEIKVLCDIALPECGIVTNIGATHLEFFATEENVFKEEGYLYHAITKHYPQHRFFLNSDDRFLSQLPRTAGTLVYGMTEKTDLRFNHQAQSIEVKQIGKVTKLSNTHITGAHNFTNLAVAWSIACDLFPEHSSIFTQATASFTPTKNRSEWKSFMGSEIYLDAYNANPSSMRAALQGFFDWLNVHQIAWEKSLVILGDMNELGENGPQYHRELGEFLSSYPMQKVFVGRFRDSYLAGSVTGIGCVNVAEVRARLKELMYGKTHIFIKGSRSLQLETILDIT